ncbi:MAG: TIGR03545 family protein [Planctomycetaceae bacterium]|nr:TIGR03545 family protein [Planctomycetaceae bacterium]
MIRWQYLIPRVVILLIVTAVLYFSLGPLLFFTIKYGGQSVTGSRVDVSSVEVDLGAAEVRLRGLMLADPENNQQNLFEADEIVLDLETDAALKRKLIVREGRVSGLRLQTKRDESGALATSDQEAEESIIDRVKQRGEAWFDSSLGVFTQDLESDLLTVQLSRELRQRWPIQYERIRLRGEQIESQGQKLKDDVERIVERPLENLHLVQPALERIHQLRRETTETRHQLEGLHRQVQLDRDALLEAKDHDVAYVRKKLHVDALNAESINDYLLGPVWSERLLKAMQWVQITRELTGDARRVASAADQDGTSRGLSVLFQGYHSTPDFLVRKLLLDGSGTVGNEPFFFAGQVAELTPQTKRHNKPMTVQVKARGAIDLVANATIDRRQQLPIDHYVVDVPALQQTGSVLGNRQQFALEIAPGVVAIRAEIQVVDQDLQGWVKLSQRNLELRPHLGPKYSKYLSSDRLQSIREINQFSAVLSISGKLQQPRWNLRSDLGTQIASSLNAAIQAELVERQRELIERGNRVVERELGTLQRNLVKDQRELLESLEIGDEQLELIKQQLMAQAGSPDQIIGQGKKLLEIFK